MYGDPIQELSSGVAQFYQAILDDDMARDAVELSIVTFSDTAECVVDFGNIERQNHTPQFHAAGMTYMGEGVELSLHLLEKRKGEYQKAGVDYFQPWLVLMTDGQPNGDNGILSRAIGTTASLVRNRKLCIFPIGIGPDADMNTLNKFSPERNPLRLQGLRFGEFFKWLSQSVVRTSMSTPGDEIPLDLEKIKSWAKL
jgi:uncharacterized protein YegL